MNSIDDNIVLEITSHLDAVSIAYFLSISNQFRKLKQNSFFDDQVVPYQQYIKNKYWNEGLLIAVTKSHITQIMYFISKGADNMNQGMYEAAKQGNRYLVQYFIQKGADDWNKALCSSALGGHKDLIDLFIEKGANDWQEAALWAITGGHSDTIKFMVEKDLYLFGIYEYMQKAIQKGDLNLVKYFAEKGFSDWRIAVDWADKSHSGKDITEYVTEQAVLSQLVCTDDDCE